MTPDDKAERIATIRRLSAEGWSGAEIAYKLGITRSGLMGFCGREGIKLPPKKGGRVKAGTTQRPKQPRAHRKSERAPAITTLPANSTPRVIVTKAPKRLDGPATCMWHGCCAPSIAPGKPYCTTHHAKSGAAFRP